MAKRDQDRIKVSIEWIQPQLESIMGSLAQEAILTRIREALPHKSTMGLPTDIRKAVTEEVVPEGIRHTHVYRFKYKRPYHNTRQCDLWNIFGFCIRMKALQDHMQGELNFKVDTDMQSNRMPWVFSNSDRAKTDGLLLGMRPGSVVYKVEDVPQVEVPYSHAAFSRILNLPADSARFGTDFMIIGEPRAALKVYRYYEQLKRGGKLNPNAQVSHKLKTAMPDLVCVLYRHNRIHTQWTVVDSDGPKMYGQFMEHILTGVPTKHAGEGFPDLGLRYEVMEVNPK